MTLIRRVIGVIYRQWNETMVAITEFSGYSIILSICAVLNIDLYFFNKTAIIRSRCTGRGST